MVPSVVHNTLCNPLVSGLWFCIFVGFLLGGFHVMGIFSIFLGGDYEFNVSSPLIMYVPIMYSVGEIDAVNARRRCRESQ